MTTIIKALAVSLALGALLALERCGYQRAKTEDAVALGQQKAEAATRLTAEIQKTLEAERALQIIKQQQESKDAKHQKTIEGLSGQLRALAGPSGRLRDPHANGCGAGGGGTPSAPASAPADHPADQPEAGGLLSADLSGLLQRITREADDINAAYASCRADAYAVRLRP